MFEYVSDFLSQYFGTYTPVTYEATTLVPLGDGTFEIITDKVVAQGLAGVDWPYVLSFVLFIAFIYIVFRFVSAFCKIFFNLVK